MPSCFTFHQSMVMVKSPSSAGVKSGWITVPNDRVSDSSGFRFGLPARCSATLRRMRTLLIVPPVAPTHLSSPVMAPVTRRASQ
ncbi:hypothetical protein D3C87_1607380 [compost metagenome]